MRFTYCYKTPDNVRHEADIEAPSRDGAFAALRGRGIKPIRVEPAEGAGRAPHRVWPWILAFLSALALGGVAWWGGRRSGGDAPYSVMTPQGPVTYSVARPLARQRIPGDRRRIEDGGNGAFRFAAEAHLAQYAEPGRPSPASQSSRLSQMSPEARAAEFKACLKEPVRIASTDFTEIADLKRIVAGMKLEMRAYLAGGGMVEQYLAELEKRQRLELSYRENAERRLNELLSEAGGAADGGRAAYSYWLKANARLQSMGIYPLPLPDALRPYQMDLEIDE